MLLSDYIDVSCIVPELEAKEKKDVLKEMTRLLFDKKKIKGVEPALDQIMARETTESTGIGHGLAVPHARVSGLKSLYCAAGRVSAGVDFAAVDKKPVNLVFLIVYPPTQQTTYLNFVATLAKMLRVPENFKALMAAADEKVFLEVLTEMAHKLAAPEEYYAKKLKADPELLQASLMDLQLGQGGLGFVGRAVVVDGDMHACVGKRQSDGTPKPVCAACYQGDAGGM